MVNEKKSDLLEALQAIESGNFRIVMDESGDDAEIAALVNKIAHRLQGLTSEIIRVSREIGTYGMFGGQSEVYGLEGSWKAAEAAFNEMAEDLTCQIRDMARVTGEALDVKEPRAVTVPAQGETRALKENINAILGNAAPVS